MADNENPQGQDRGFAAWPPPTPGAFREFGAQSGWPQQQQPPAGFPAGYPAQPPMRPPAPGVPGPGYWQPGAMPPSAQGGFPGGPGQPPGFTPNQPPPPRNSLFLIVALGGLALLVILVPLVLLGLSHNSPTPVANNSQPTTAPNAPTPTPAPPASFFTPDGTAPTTQQCMKSISVACYSPEEMQQAFNLVPLYKQGYDGKGQTIVILGAGNSPTIENDLKAFDKAWGLPDPPSFQVIQPFGPPVKYSCAGGGGDGLQLENTLDVEWSHAMAPGANIILLIGANTEHKYFPVPKGVSLCGLYDLEDGVAYVTNHHLGNIVSISYGGSELGARTDTPVDKANEKKEFDAADAIFKRAVSAGITVLASAGDDGATGGDDNVDPSKFWDKPTISWPASDPYILAIGGTTLQIKDATGTYGSETVWNDNGSTGGGLSAIYGEPSYQKSVQNQALFNGKRGIPDIAFPAENFSLYETADFGDVGVKWPHWTVIGGTSASAPSWAGLIAISDQISAQAGGGALGFIHPGLYSLQDQGFHDITQGDNSYVGVQGYSAQPGYDLASGWGTPIADQLLPALVQAVQQAGNKP